MDIVAIVYFNPLYVEHQRVIVVTKSVVEVRLIHHAPLTVALQLLPVQLLIIGIVMTRQAVQMQVQSGVLDLVEQVVIVQALHLHVHPIHAIKQIRGIVKPKLSVKE